MILAVNRGSSSIKFAVYGEDFARPVVTGKLERIGLPAASFRAWDGANAPLVDRRVEASDHRAALAILLDWLRERDYRLSAAGHRLVHGGAVHDQPALVTPDLMAELKSLIPLAPEHLPQEIEAIEAVARLHGDLPQVACFDTAFHRRMPRVAQLYGLPRELSEEGLLRYGFHGLSYEYIAGQLPRGRVIAAHLGNGASVCALRDGASLDTSMGFTPMGGIVMSTRSGDLDPSVVLHLIQQKNMAPAVVRELLNERSGLLGISGVSSDMRDLRAAESANPAAAEAVALFCYQARKQIGAYAAALDGVDALVFAGGIGENDAPVRQRICEGLGYLGVRLDADANARHADVISAAGSGVEVRVIRTNEEVVVARHTRSLMDTK